MDRGQRVILRSTLNQPVIRRVWSSHNGVVVICREETFADWKTMKIEPRGIEVRQEDVFEYDRELFEQMKEYDEVLDSNPKGLEELWAKAKALK